MGAAERPRGEGGEKLLTGFVIGHERIGPVRHLFIEVATRTTSA